MARRTDRSEDSRDHQPSPKRPKRDFKPSLEALEQRMVLSTYELSVALRDTPVLPPESPFSVSSRTPDGQETRMTDPQDIAGVSIAGQPVIAKGESGKGAWAAFSDQEGEMYFPAYDKMHWLANRAVIAPGLEGNSVVAAWTAPAKGKADIYLEVRNIAMVMSGGFTYIGEVRTALGNVMTLGQGILTSDERAVLTKEHLKLETEPGDSVRIIVLPDGKNNTKDGRYDFAETIMQVEYEPEPILVQPLLDIEDTSPPPPGAIAKLSAAESLSYADEAAGTLFTVQRWENELLDRQRTLDHIMEPLPAGPTAEDLQIQTMTKTLESYQTELANLPVYEADLKKQLADTTALITQLTNQINALTALINQCTTQINALTAQIAVTPIAQRPPLVAQRSALLVQRADYAAQRTALQTQKTAASALVKTLKAQIAAIPARRKFLQATIPTLTAQLAALRAWRAAHPTYREQLQMRRDAVDAALDDVFLLKHSSRSLLEQTGAEIDDAESRPFAPTVINGTWLTAQTQGWIDDIPDASRVGQMVQEVLAESITESDVTVDGTITVSDTAMDIPLSIPLLGGDGHLRAERLPLTSRLEIPESSQALQERLARLQEGGAIDTTSIGSRLTWTTPYGTDWVRSAELQGVGTVQFQAWMRRDWSRSRYPEQYMTTAASGNLVLDHPDGTLRIFIPDGTYVHGMNIVLRGEGQATSLLLYLSDGSTRTLQLTEGGIVPIGEELSSIVLMVGKGMEAEIQSIDTRASTPDATEPDLSGGARVISGGVGVIDLAEAESLITRVTGTAETFTGQGTLRATAYRSEQQLGSMVVDSDGRFSFEDAEGITSVIISGAQGNMILRDITVEGVQGTPQVSAAAVSSETNNTVAVATAPQIADFTWNTGNNSILGMLGINRGGGSMNNWLYSRLGYLVYTRPTEYLIVRIRGGNEKFRSLRYFDEDAQPRDYPSDGYEVHGNFLIVHPAPHRDLWLDFDGSYLVSDITASAREAIMPPINPTPVLDLLIRRPLVSYEGNWGAYITEIRSGSNAFGAFKGIFNIENRGQNGITFEEIRVHIGSTGTTADPITYTLAEHKYLPGGGTASLALPVDADPTQSNQLWSISALTNTGEVIVLRGGSGLLPPRPRGSDPTRDAHTIRMIIESGERMGMSEAALKDFRDAYQELADTGALSPETSNKIFVSQHIVQMNLEAIVERNMRDLKESYGGYFGALGVDDVSAGIRTIFAIDMGTANIWIWADEVGVPYTGTAENIQKILTMKIAQLKQKTMVLQVTKAGGNAYTSPNMTSIIAAGVAIQEGTGGSDDGSDGGYNTVSQKTLLRRAIGWYDGGLVDVPFALKQDSPIARIFLGLLQQMQGKSLLDQITLARTAEAVTLIPHIEILRAIQDGCGDPVFTGQYLRALFEAKGYGHLFDGPNGGLRSVALTLPPTVAPLEERDFFPIQVNDGDGLLMKGKDILLRFDVAPKGSTISHAYAYLLDQNGNEIGGPLTTEIHALAVRIPRSAIEARMTNATEYFRIKLAMWYTDSGTSAKGAKTDPFLYTKGGPDVATGDYSTLPDADPRRPIENDILKQTVFPLEGRDWTYGIVSSWHYGNGLFALDLNRHKDYEDTVLAPISGEVTDVDILNGDVTIKGTLASGKMWTVTLRHLLNIFSGVTGMTYTPAGQAARELHLATKYAVELAAVDESIENTKELIDAIKKVPAALAELQPTLNCIAEVQAAIDALRQNGGLRVNLGEAIAGVGDEGYSEGSHLHMEMVLDGKPINLFGWVEEYLDNLQPFVQFENRGLDMQYNEEARTLVHNEERIAMRRFTVEGAGVNYAYAWEEGVELEQMEQIAWQQTIFIDDNGITQNARTWVSVSYPSKRWRVRNGIGEFVPCL